MKIACDVRVLQTENIADGTARYARELLLALADVGRPLRLYALGYRNADSPCLDQLRGKGVRFLPAFDRSGSTARDYALQQVVYPRLLRKHGIDLYHGLFQTETLLFSSVPQCITVHDLGPYLSYPAAVRSRIGELTGEKIAPDRRGLLRLAFVRRARKVIAVSRYTRDKLIEARLAPAGKIAVVYSGLAAGARIPAETVRRTLGACGLRQPYLLMVGRIQALKNILGAIEAFALLRDRRAFDGQLVVAGTARFPSEKAYLDQCRGRVRARGLEGRVVFPGYVPDETLSCIYAGARVFLQSSFLEGFGFPPLEAASFGVPVVVSDAGSLPEIIPRAVRVSPFDPASIAGGIARALAMGTAPALSWRSWRQTADETAGLYERALGAQGGRR